ARPFSVIGADCRADRHVRAWPAHPARPSSPEAAQRLRMEAQIRLWRDSSGCRPKIIGSALRAKHQCRRDQRGKAEEQTEDKRLERAPALAPPERANLRAKIADRRECAVRKRALALDHPLSHVFGHGVDYLDDVSVY